MRGFLVVAFLLGNVWQPWAAAFVGRVPRRAQLRFSPDRIVRRCSWRRQHRRHRLCASSVVVANEDDIYAVGGGNVKLWLDMRNAPLPALETLELLYAEMRERDEVRREQNRDEDSTENELFKRVPNPVGALAYAPQPEGRAQEDHEALGGGMPCFVFGVDGDVIEVVSGAKVGVKVDPTGEGGAERAVQAVTEGAALLVLDVAKPSEWTAIPEVIEMTAGACVSSGAVLAVTVRSMGQMNDAAMAALRGIQTLTFGLSGKEESTRKCALVLLLEPEAAMWEMGMMYL